MNGLLSKKVIVAKVNWLRLFCVFSVGVFLIAVIAYVWVEWLISTQTTKNMITDESEHADASKIPKTWPRTAFTPKETRVQQKSGNAGDEWSFEQGLTDSSDEQGLVQFESQEVHSLTGDRMESGHGTSEVEEAKPSACEIRIAEIKKRIDWLSEQIKQLDEEEATLPPRPPIEERRLKRSPTFFTREEMERENEIVERRREIRLRSVELSTELFNLRRELNAN